MKKCIVLTICLIGFLGCKENKKEETKDQRTDLSILEKVAHAHGFDSFKNLEEIQFTFNVERDTSHFERSWAWSTNTNRVKAMGNGDEVVYARKNVDSTTAKVDAGFINDKYWLLAPFNLIWDRDNITYEHQTDIPAPISKDPMQKLTIVYGNDGGYTPGDAYDFYFGPNFLIREWVYRRGNQEEASTTTTWEDYEDFNGLKIAKMHKNDDGSFQLYFTGIKTVTTNP